MVTRNILFTAALVPALLLAGCGGTPNRGLESVHQPVVSRTDYVFDVATQGGRLAPGETRRLAGWMASLHPSYGDQVAIDDPAPYGRTIHDEVSAELMPYGLVLSDDAPVTGAPIAPGTVRVVVTRLHAAVPGCPDWSRDESHEFNSNTSSNQGCAVNSNLAAMIANPGDLIHGRSGDAITDPATASKSIDLYRKSAPTGGGGSVIKSESAGGK